MRHPLPVSPAARLRGPTDVIIRGSPTALLGILPAEWIGQETARGRVAILDRFTSMSGG